jgi:hypothetical protein
MSKLNDFVVPDGKTSRPARADLPKSTYERNLAREGFFGATTHINRRCPTMPWSDFTTPLTPPWPGNLLRVDPLKGYDIREYQVVMHGRTTESKRQR